MNKGLTHYPLTGGLKMLDWIESKMFNLGFDLGSLMKRQSLRPGIIFVANDALAFFDSNEPPNKPIDAAEIRHNPLKKSYDLPYHFLIESKEVPYFRTDNHEFPLRTVSITLSCIVFCAFTTDGNGEIKSSGVYHALSMPPSDFFTERLHELIDTVRAEPEESVTVKAAGSNINNQEGLQDLEEEITEILAEKGVEIKPDHILLGGGAYITELLGGGPYRIAELLGGGPYRIAELLGGGFFRITEFYPGNGHLITYSEGSIRKKIL